MDYWSILVAALLGALGGGVGHWTLLKFSKNKQFASIAGAVGAILFYQILHPIVYDNYLQPMVEKSKINKTLNEIVKYNRPLLPRMLDEVTRQDTIEATDLKLKYEYTIMDERIDKNYFDKNFDAIKKSVKLNTCREKIIKELVQHHVVLEYVYKLKNSSDTFTYELNSCE